MAIKGAQEEFNFGANAYWRCRLLTWCLRVVVEDMRATFEVADLLEALVERVEEQDSRTHDLGEAVALLAECR